MALARGLRFLECNLRPRCFVLAPTLMVIGLNHRTAPLAMRERFGIRENRRYEVLRSLQSAEGIEKVVVLSTCCRTEFLIWATEPTLAANSVLHFLGVDHGLKLTKWEQFYRLLDEASVTQISRVTCGLDSLVLGEAAEAEKIVAAEAQAFRGKLQAESVVPTVVALQHRLEQICRQNWSPSSQSAGRVPGSRISHFTQSQRRSYKRR